MASGTIERTIPKLKNVGLVSLPYTPPQSGFLLISLNPSTASGGYVILRASSTNYVFNAANGTTASASLPIVGGEQITQSTVSGVTPSYYAFLFD